MASQTNYIARNLWRTFLLTLTTCVFSIRMMAQSVGPTLISPSNGAVNQPLTVTLQWYSLINATSYEVQIATDSNFNSVVMDKTTSDTMISAGPLSRATQYYWRVRGTYLLVTTSWSSVWNFTTIPQIPSVPVLLQPQNNAVNQPSSVTFSWNAVSGASTYRLQVSTDSTFASAFVDQNALASTSYTASGFSSGTTYFWRVNSSNAGGTSAWSSVWRFNTAQAVPSTPILLSPTNGATNQSTSLLFSWNAAANADHYWLQISTSSSFSTIVIGDSTITSTSHQVNYLSNGTQYYWRVKAMNSSGESGWSTVWDFTTASAQSPPATPSLLSPSNGATNQPTNPTLSWSAVTGADHYSIQVATDSRFSNMVYTNYTLINTSVQLTGLAYETTYYWQVRAENAAGNSSWAGAWSFTTGSAILPSTPALVSPANGAVDQPLNVKLVWNKSPNASSYHVQLSTVSDFSSKVIDDSLLTDTTQTVGSLTNGTDYYWRVSASDSNGVSAWASPWKFTTVPSVPLPPVLASPANGSTIDTTFVTLSWSASSGATSYWLQNGTDSVFHTVMFSDSTITALSQKISGLMRDTDYFWRVSAKNSGGRSAWSTVWKFAVVTPPQAPTPTNPPDGAIIDSTTVTLAWQASNGATSYWLQVSTDSTFQQMLVYNDSSLTTTSQQVSGLQPATKYFWRVNASKSGQRSPWTQPNSFATTSSNSTTGPDLVSPPNGATDQPINPTLSWSSTSGASGYELQVATDQSFSKVVYDNAGISGTWQKIGPLANSTTYYWHVRSFVLLFASDWSSTWSFKTVAATETVPPVPTLLSPANGAVNQSTTPTLSWNASSSATAYQLQVSTDSAFSSTLFNDSTLSATSHSIGPLAVKSSFYWHVRAKNSAGWSAYSSLWKFSTGDTASKMPIAVTMPATGINATSATLNATVNANGFSTTVNFQYDTTASLYRNSIAGIPSTIGGDTATTITRTLTGLIPNTTYHYRISATNQAGIAYGADETFTTNDTTHSAPTAITLPPANVTSTSAIMRASVNPHGYETTVNFQYGTTTAYGNSIGGIPLHVNGDTATIVANTINGLTPYTTYHYRVSATNQAGSMEGNDQTFTTALPPYPSSFSLDTTFFFPTYQNPSDYKATDYQIVGVPGNSGTRIDSLLTGTQKKDWAVYWDNGAGANNLVPFNGGANFTLSTGKAFWLIRKGAWRVKMNVPSAPMDSSSQTVNIPLHSGWNLITNPYTSSIAWSSLQHINSTSEPIYAFHKSFDTSAVFQPYGGYYFFNKGNISSLKVPYTALFPSPSQRNTNPALGGIQNLGKVENEWKIQIMFSSPDGITDHSTWLGVSEDVHGENNPMDVHKPAGVQDIPSVYFSRPEWDSTYSTFAADIRPLFTTQSVWDFDVWTPDRTKAQLTFEGINTVPEQFEIYLFDTKASRVINLRKNPSYAFTPAQQTSQFLLAVGIKDSLEQMAKSVRTPQSFELGNNYPNPFNPTTSIPVEISARADIELKIFNLLGQEVKQLYKGTLDAGKYWFTWDGTDSQRQAVASGYYFYRMVTSTGYYKVKTMVLVR